MDAQMHRCSVMIWREGCGECSVMIWREGCGERLEAWEGGYVCIIIADLNYCMAETNTILYKFKK